MTTWLNETYTDTALALLTAHTSDSGATYASIFGNSPQIFDVGGQGMVGPGPGGDYSVTRSSVIAPSPDAKITFTFNVFSLVSFAGKALRVSGANATLRGYVGLINTASDKAEIWKLDNNGTLTGAPLAQSAALGLSAGANGTGEFSAVGSLLSLIVNGTTVTYTDTSITAAGYEAEVFASSQGTGIFFNSKTAQDIATAATAITASGPSPTSGNVGAASNNITIGANGVITGAVVVTPSDGGGGGSFTPSTASISAGTPTATMTYTPGTNGTKTLSFTNNGSLTPPSTISYTATAVGTPVAGTASFLSASASTINVSTTAATGGTAPVTRQWYRSTTANALGTALSGATSLTLADTTGAADTPYYYTCRFTDAAALTADSNQVAGVLKAATLKLGFIGDSITAGYGLSAGQDPATQIVAILQKTFKSRVVTATNAAVSGSKSSQWVTGQSNLTTAKTAFAAAGVTHIHCMLGANDAGAANLVSAATYKANLQNIITDLTGAGYKVILSYPTYIPAGANSNATTAAGVALGQSYQSQIDSLIDGVNVLRGDTLAFNYFADNLGEYQADLVHPTATGALSLATMWARAIDRSVLDSAAGPALTARTVTLSGVKTDASTLATGLTGVKVSFRDAASPEAVGAITYQSAIQTITGGVLTFGVNTSLASGATGWIDIKAAGVHFCGPVAVA